jgi:putrescine transport system substrate-binding protein
MGKTRFWISTLVSIAVGICMILLNKPSTPKRVVNIYDWYGMLSIDLLKEFEQKTGIHVQYDVYSDNETAEVKLLAGHSGYDLIFPSAIPYAAWQVQSGLYAPIDFSKLPVHRIDPLLWKRMQRIDPTRQFLIPYYWGTIGLVYDVKKVEVILGELFNKHKESWALLFEPTVVEKLSPYGVSILEESSDVFPIVELYLKGSIPVVLQKSQMAEIVARLRVIRPFLSKITSSHFLDDLIMGEVVVAQTWSGDGNKAVREAQKIGKTLSYITPLEGSMLWFDCIAIPLDAPHPEEAYEFIRFLLDPRVAAYITNRTLVPTTVSQSIQWVHKDIRNNPHIFLQPPQINKLYLNQIPKNKKDFEDLNTQNRFWVDIRRH